MTMTLAERLRANLTRAMAHHRCAGGPLLTITTLAPLAGTTRSTLAGLGGHTRLSTFQGIAGALGCSVAHLVEGVEPVTPVDLGQQPNQLEEYEVVVGLNVKDWPSGRP